MSTLSGSPRITPFLWFNDNAEEAAKFYISLFADSRITGTTFYGDNMPLPKGTAMTVSFELEGLQFTALNGGPHFKFNEAVSFVIHCDTQEEIDRFWNALTTNGGTESQCGWCKDRFGLSWQIVPGNIGELARSGKAMQLLMGMKKIDKHALEAAAQA